MSTDIETAATPASTERLEPADLVVGATACVTTDAVARAAECVRLGAGQLGTGLRAVLVHPNTVSPAEVLAGREADPALQLVPHPLPAVGRLPFASADARDLFQPLATVGEQVGARACAVVGALAEGITPEAVQALLAPVLDQRLDLVLPHYPRHRLDGLINSGIVYPLTRTLYGKRVDGQLGVDFGFSRSMLEVLAAHRSAHGRTRPLWLLTEATVRGLQVGQANLSTWLPPVEHATDVSTALVQVLGSLFEDMEQHAAVWQRSRNSQEVPTFGSTVSPPDEHRAVDVGTMIDTFGTGFRNLREVWARLLPPATLLELNRLLGVAPDAFRLPDPLWARIVFDFGLGHRLRVINRDHLLRAMTPLYLAWVASFVLEVRDIDPDTARVRLERLCSAYEAEKPYLVARWRWPDRFNP